MIRDFCKKTIRRYKNILKNMFLFCIVSICLQNGHRAGDQNERHIKKPRKNRLDLQASYKKSGEVLFGFSKCTYRQILMKLKGQKKQNHGEKESTSLQNEHDPDLLI